MMMMRRLPWPLFNDSINSAERLERENEIILDSKTRQFLTEEEEKTFSRSHQEFFKTRPTRLPSKNKSDYRNNFFRTSTTTKSKIISGISSSVAAVVRCLRISSSRGFSLAAASRESIKRCKKVEQRRQWVLIFAASAMRIYYWFTTRLPKARDKKGKISSQKQIMDWLC